jgi:Kae1-associated kinase Bud32
MKLIAKGAEAEIFEVEREGMHQILKQRVKKRYRLEQLDRKLRSFRTRREAKVLHAAKLAGILCPLIYDADMEKTELYMQKIEGEQLRTIFEGKGGRLTKLANKKIIDFVFDAGVALAKLHNANIVHGDYQTANIMVTRKGEIAIIDFGLADFSSSVEDKATDLVVFKKAVDEKQFSEFLKGYKKASANFKPILSQLSEIEQRGRYVSRAQAG